MWTKDEQLGELQGELGTGSLSSEPSPPPVTTAGTSIAVRGAAVCCSRTARTVGTLWFQELVMESWDPPAEVMRIAGELGNSHIHEMTGCGSFAKAA